jgi:hypothetical protein
MACNMSWFTIGCAMQQLLIVMLIFQQLLLGVHSLLHNPRSNYINSTTLFTNSTDGKLLMIHFHYSFVIFVSVRESMR